MKPLLPLTAALLLAALDALPAGVQGRIIRIEAPASSRMALYEIEAWSGSANLARNNKSVSFAGTGQETRGDRFPKEARQLVDGVVDFSSRGTQFGATGERELNPWLELDLGSSQSVDKLVISQPRKPLYDDRAIRLVTVLDAQRRVVWAARFDLRRAPFDKGVATLKLEPTRSALIGRVVPPKVAQWAPLGDMLEPAPSPAPPRAVARTAAFEQRHSPEAIAQLAREFFARIDLSKPELAGVRLKFQQNDFAAALNAYRDHFLAKLQRVAFLHEHPVEQSAYATAGEDLLRNVSVVFARFDAVAKKFSPGTIYWTEATEAEKGELDTARVRCLAGTFQRPLLTAFRATGRPEFLAQWSAITDDWGLNIRADLAQAKEDMRDYFVKDPLQSFNHLADELGQTAKQQPALAKLLSGATLARLLIPVLEEYPPAYWWPCRRATFNHTYNALNAASVTARVLDDFYAGERLDRENFQHWQRVWTMMMTRDGSMNEIGDEGHMTMQWRMGVFFSQMQKTPPPWFTPDFAAEFENGWRQTATYWLRHLSPNGMGHRFAINDAFPTLWQLTDRTCTIGGMIPRETLDSTGIMRQPEVAGIMQSVFGAARDRAKLSPERQAAWDKVTGFYGQTFTPPTTVSDWMPYAGLHYLRRSWEPDATFVTMIAQPMGHASVNGSDWNTELRLWDYGQPLMAFGPVTVDGAPFFSEAGKRTFRPGSKTLILATASEQPIPARWHTSARFDYAESFCEGTYQQHGVDGRQESLKLGENIIAGVRAERRVILVRPARLVIVTDSVRAPEPEKTRRYELTQRFWSSAAPAKRKVELKDTSDGTIVGDARTTSLKGGNLPGVTVRRFTEAKLSWNKKGQPSWWDKDGELRADSTNGLNLASLIEPHRRDGDAMVKDARDLSAGGVAGFSATLTNGATLTWLAASGEARSLKAGLVELTGEGLLVWLHGDEIAGLALGAKSLRVGAQNVSLPATDFEFSLQNNRLTSVTPIHRPIEPVTFSPAECVFTDTARVTLASATPGMEIHYTLDGTDPDFASPLYTAPLTITKDAFIRARSFRPGVKSIPFAAAGTDVTVISETRFHKRELRPAIATQKLASGLRWELASGTWFALFSHLHLRDVMPAQASGITTRFPDVTMRQGEGPFGVRYDGLIEIPADGVWTFHAPAEYVGASCEPGYDLRVWIDGEEWALGQRFHGRGLWSVPLAKGFHRLQITFADARNRDRTVPNSGLWRGYPTPWVLWQGEAPVVGISGPNAPKQPLPAVWLQHHVP